jgi:type II secretory pathway pseudopilin PulG
MMREGEKVASCALRVACRKLRVARCASRVNARHLTRNPQRATRNYYGFSFIEVLFAVILLGIGFIMIAGVFPVAIQQASAVSDETQGMLIARDAVRKLQAIGDQPGAGALFTPCVAGGVVAPIVQPIGANQGLLTALGNDGLFSSDHRYSWLGFYRRDSTTSPFAQVFVIALENPNFANYQGNPSTMPSGTIPPPICPPLPQNPVGNTNGNSYGNPYGFAPSVITSGTTAGEPAPTATVTLNYDTNSGNSSVTFASQTLNAVSGAYLLICDDLTTPPNNTPPAGVIAPVLNGRILRLGTEITVSGGAQTFNLQPGFDLQTAPPGTQSPDLTLLTTANNNKGTNVNVYIIGRAPTLNTTSGITNDYTGPFTGPNQDIAAASAFIRINTANN